MYGSEDIRFKNKVNSDSANLVGIGNGNNNIVSAKPGIWDAIPKSQYRIFYFRCEDKQKVCHS